MGTLFGFAVGYVIGARAGNEGFDQLSRAVRDIRDSREFQDFLALLKEHARSTAQIVSERLAGDESLDDQISDVLASARARLSLPDSED